MRVLGVFLEWGGSWVVVVDRIECVSFSEGFLW